MVQWVGDVHQANGASCTMGVNAMTKICTNLHIFARSTAVWLWVKHGCHCGFNSCNQCTSGALTLPAKVRKAAASVHWS